MSNRRKDSPLPTAGQLSSRRVIAEIARLRVEAVWRCLGVLLPDVRGEAKKELARKMLSLCDGADRTPAKPLARQITPAQVEGMVWENMQCINPRCPMLLFSRQIAEELNDFFRGGG